MATSQRQAVATAVPTNQSGAARADGGYRASGALSTTIPTGARLRCFTGTGEVRGYTGALVGVSTVVMRALYGNSFGKVVTEERWDESESVITVIDFSDDKLELASESKGGQAYFQASGRYVGQIWPWESWDYQSSGPIQVQAEWKQSGNQLVGTINYDIGSSSWVISTINLRPAELRVCDDALGDPAPMREHLQ